MALSDNLQGWWCPSLDTAGNGTTTLTDLSGNGNNGTLTNMDAATDWVDPGGGLALDFDGGNDHVRVSAAINSSTQSRTVAGWFYLRSVGASDSNPCMFHSGTMYLAVDGANTQPQAFLGAAWRNGSAGLSLNNWHHIAYGTNVSPTTTTKIWLDGSPVYESSLPLGAGNSLFSIGARTDAISPPFCVDGFFGAAAIWHRLITDDEIANLYAGGRSLNLLASGSGNIAHVLRSIQQQHESVVTL